MKQDEIYNIWLKISISHTYFANKSHVFLKPTDQTRVILQKTGILFRQISECEWGLLAPIIEDISIYISLLSDDYSELSFDVNPKSTDFYFYTEREAIVAGNVECEYIGYNNIFSRIKVNISLMDAVDVTKIGITYKSKMKYWEFILIPKYNRKVTSVILADSIGDILLKQMENVAIPGETQMALRFISDRLIELKESYPNQICLWENLEKGKRLLCNNIPHPQDSAISIFQPEMITSYFYF